MRVLLTYGSQGDVGRVLGLSVQRGELGTERLTDVGVPLVPTGGWR